MTFVYSPIPLLLQFLAVGITNQRETTLAWDRVTGQPLHNALVWCDARTHDLVHLIKQRQDYDENRLRELCGLSVSTYFSAVKLTWLLENVEEVRKAVQEERMMFGTVDSWLVYVSMSRIQQSFRRVSEDSRERREGRG